MTRRFERTVCIFVKAPLAGRAKTRLGGTIGLAAAAELASAFFEDTFEMARSSRADRVVVAVDGDAAALPAVAADAVWPQGDGDLGERLERIIGRALVEATSVVVVGTDSPGLPASRIDAAFEAVAPGQVAFGPAEDGGFYLFATQACPVGMFRDVGWSRADTLATAAARVMEVGLAVERLSDWFDVDTESDLERLVGALRAGTLQARATAAALRRLARL